MASIISAGTTSGTALNMAGDTSGVLQLATNGSTTALTIDTSQNVGIGTTSPVYATGGGLSIYNATAARIKLGDSTSGIGSLDGVELIYDDDAYLFNRENTALIFGTNNTERMRIDSSGYVFINQTSRNGNTNAKLGLTFNGDIEWGISVKSSLNSASNAGSPMSFQNYLGTQIGQINITNSSTAYVTSSDYRLKENIAPMTGALDKVSALKPVTYTWKTDGSDGQGFIAHELQSVVPDCVTGEKDAVDAEGNPKYQGVDTSFLVATLTAAIQEQQTIINDLKARITALEGAA